MVVKLFGPEEEVGGRRCFQSGKSDSVNVYALSLEGASRGTHELEIYTYEKYYP